MAKTTDADVLLPYPGSPMSERDLTLHYEASKYDEVGLVGSEVRQIIGELRHWRKQIATLSTPHAEGTDTPLVDAMARAIHAAHMKELGPLRAWTWEEAAKLYYNNLALAAIPTIRRSVLAEVAGYLVKVSEDFDRGFRQVLVELADAIQSGKINP